jgi:hypothetical protein
MTPLLPFTRCESSAGRTLEGRLQLEANPNTRILLTADLRSSRHTEGVLFVLACLSGNMLQGGSIQENPSGVEQGCGVDSTRTRRGNHLSRQVWPTSSRAVDVEWTMIPPPVYTEEHGGLDFEAVPPRA